MKSELIATWIDRGDRAREAAEHLLTTRPDFTDVAALLCHQAAEKYLKALAMALDMSIARTHNTTYLLDLLDDREEVPEDIYEAGETLEDYAAELTFPDEWTQPSPEEARQAVELAGKIREFVQQRLQNS